MIEIKINGLTVAEILEQIQKLAGTLCYTVQLGQKEDPAVDNEPNEPQTAPTKPRRKRRTKAEMEAARKEEAVAAAEPPEASATTEDLAKPEPVSEPEPELEPQTPVDFEQIRVAALELVKAKGRDALVNLFADYGATKVSELKENELPAVLTAIKEAMA